MLKKSGRFIILLVFIVGMSLFCSFNNVQASNGPEKAKRVESVSTGQDNEEENDSGGAIDNSLEEEGGELVFQYTDSLWDDVYSFYADGKLIIDNDYEIWESRIKRVLESHDLTIDDVKKIEIMKADRLEDVCCNWPNLESAIIHSSGYANIQYSFNNCKKLNDVVFQEGNSLWCQIYCSFNDIAVKRVTIPPTEDLYACFGQCRNLEKMFIKGGRYYYTDMPDDLFNIPKWIDLEFGDIIFTDPYYSYDNYYNNTVVFIQGGKDSEYEIEGAKKVYYNVASPAALDSVAYCQMSLQYSKVRYDGYEKRPSVTVRDGKTTLVKDRDYTVSYTNNIAKGKGKVTIKGIGQYCGTKTQTFDIYKLTPKITAKNIKKDKKSKAQRFSIGAKIVSDGDVTYYSNNSNITVNPYGVVTIKKKYVGSAIITIKVSESNNYNPITKKIRIKVYPPKINKTYANKYRGSAFRLKVLHTDKKVKWKSTNRKVATVNAKGAVKCKEPGKCWIIGKIGKKTYKCRVKVTRQRPNFGAQIIDYDTRDNQFFVKFKNKSNRRLIITSGIKVEDDDYPQFDRKVYINKRVVIKPNQTKYVAFQVRGSSTWWDYNDYFLDYHFTFDGRKYKGSTRRDVSLYYNGKWKKTYKDSEWYYNWRL